MIQHYVFKFQNKYKKPEIIVTVWQNISTFFIQLQKEKTPGHGVMNWKTYY